MMILKYRNNESYNELLSKLKKIRRFSEELEDFLCNAEEESSYGETQRTSYRDDYDNNESRSMGRYYYQRR